MNFCALKRFFKVSAPTLTCSSIGKSLEWACEKLPPSSQKIHPPVEIAPSLFGHEKPASSVIL